MHAIRRAPANDLLGSLCLAVGLLAAGPLAGQDEEPAKEKAPSPVAIEAVTIDPSAPGVDTLCQLRVRVKSSAEKTISSFDFGVSIGGAPLEVYEKQLFLDALEPGKAKEIRLYNFWTTETGRPAPADGKLRLTVTLRGARWVEITTEEDGTEVWTLGDEVPGLPVAQELVVPLAKSAPVKK